MFKKRLMELDEALDRLTVTTGRTFFVMASTAAGYEEFVRDHEEYLDGTDKVYNTPADAIDACVANRGDKIYVNEEYTETLTAKLDLDVAGISVIGLGEGLRKPTFSVNGTVDGVEFSADDVTFDNFHFLIVTTDAATSMINIDDGGAIVKNITGIASISSKAFVDCITITANGNDCLIDGVEIWNALHPVNSFLSFEGAAARVTVKNFFAFGDVDTAGIIDAAKVAYLHLENVTVGVVGTTKPAATLDSNPEGVAINCKFAGTHTTLATNANMGNLMRLFNVWVTEETDGSKQGAQIPAVDAD